ncbi:MAG TPA: DNA-formamidopyrimidine glycosylase family protein [Acidimicrobiia bacterium]|jgi:endonuclease-8|nr:DNA-formamidopyrimidine glycosylase family protein [Acidimicrobiia bacterium]
MPEGDTIHRAAAQLRGALAGKRVVKVEVRRDPRGRRGVEPGATVTEVVAQGKHLLIHFDDGHVLHTHMQLTGAWQVYAPGERWRRPAHTARVVLEVEGGTTAVCFAAPLVELRTENARDVTHAANAIAALGPDLCLDAPDLDAVLARVARLDPATELALVLLDQRVAAGIGNVYKSEVCWAEKVWPFTPIGALADATRRRMYATAHRQLRANLGTKRRVTYQGGLAVYGKAGRLCPRCRTRIVRRGGRDDERVTYWCPTCQPEP